MRHLNFMVELNENPTATAQEKGECIRYDRYGKPYIHHFEKAPVAKLRKEYTLLFKQALKEIGYNDGPFEGPVELTYEIHFKTADKKLLKQVWKDTKPDEDNAIKLPQDVLADLGLFKVGDSQIAVAHIYEKWGAKPLVAIEMKELRGDT